MTLEQIVVAVAKEDNPERKIAFLTTQVGVLADMLREKSIKADKFELKYQMESERYNDLLERILNLRNKDY